MLRLRPTEISMTLNDVHQSTVRVATVRVATNRAVGKARIRQGPERSRDEGMRGLGRGPNLHPPRRATRISNSDSGSRDSREIPKFLFTSATGISRSSLNVTLVSSSSSDGQSSDAESELVVPHKRNPPQSGLALHTTSKAPVASDFSQLQFDGQVDPSTSNVPKNKALLTSLETNRLNPITRVPPQT